MPYLSTHVLIVMEIPPYPVIDLFAGPGGLGEGFATATGSNGQFPLPLHSFCLTQKFSELWCVIVIKGHDWIGCKFDDSIITMRFISVLLLAIIVFVAACSDSAMVEEEAGQGLDYAKWWPMWSNPLNSKIC